MWVYQDVLGGVLGTPGLVHFLDVSPKAFSLSLLAGLYCGLLWFTMIYYGLLWVCY